MKFEQIRDDRRKIQKLDVISIEITKSREQEKKYEKIKGLSDLQKNIKRYKMCAIGVRVKEDEI